MSRRLGKIEFAEKAQKAVDKYCASRPRDECFSGSFSGEAVSSVVLCLTFPDCNYALVTHGPLGTQQYEVIKYSDSDDLVVRVFRPRLTQKFKEDELND